MTEKIVAAAADNNDDDNDAYTTATTCIISGTGKAIDFKFGRYIHSVHPNNSPLKIWRKGSVGVTRDCSNLRMLTQQVQ